MSTQRSALYDAEAATGATFRSTHGWEAPAVYSDIAAEYAAITTAAAIHDASYVGRLKAAGEDALDLLNRLSTNQVIDLEPGQGAPTILTTDRGRILDLIGVVNRGEDVLLITSPGAQEQVIEFLDKYTIMEDLEVEDVTPASAMLSVIGPGSGAALQETAGVSLEGLSPYHNVAASIAGEEVRIVCRPMGELASFDVLVSTEAAPAVWESLVSRGIIPAGCDAMEATRVRYAVPAHGSEMGEPYNPLEAGLIGSIDFAKGCYIGQEVIARLDTYQRVQKYLVRLNFSLGARAEPGATLLRDGKPAGTVTSITHLPGAEGPIGMAYVRKTSADPGVTLELESPAQGSAEILDLPQLFGPGEG